MEHLISKENAKTIQNNFFKNQENVRLGNQNAIKNERSDFWFPSSDLSNYIRHTQEMAKSKGYEITGYRMYLGAEENKEDSSIGKYKLFIIPTRNINEKSKSNILNDSRLMTSPNPEDIEAGLHEDDTSFDPFDLSGCGNPPKVFQFP